MSEAARAAVAARSAGALLREARQAQGLHIAALAAAIKVSPRKLEALEADRFDELPDATFARALALTVCRALRIDPAPVLALLPAQAGHRLEHVSSGINAPFNDRPGRREPGDGSRLASPAVWGALLLIVAAAVIYLMPSGWVARLQFAPGPAASAGDASAPAAAPVTQAPAPAASAAN